MKSQFSDKFKGWSAWLLMSGWLMAVLAGLNTLAHSQAWQKNICQSGAAGSQLVNKSIRNELIRK